MVEIVGHNVSIFFGLPMIVFRRLPAGPGHIYVDLYDAGEEKPFVISFLVPFWLAAFQELLEFGLKEAVGGDLHNLLEYSVSLAAIILALLSFSQSKMFEMKSLMVDGKHYMVILVSWFTGHKHVNRNRLFKADSSAEFSFCHYSFFLRNHHIFLTIVFTQDSIHCRLDSDRTDISKRIV